MKDENAVISALEERITTLERQVFGDEIDSKVQQNRQVIEEIVQINSQILRSVASRESVAQLMKKVEDMIDFLDLEESSQLLGGEAKANAVLAAEPIIRQMYGIIKEISLDQVNEAINSEALRNLTSLSGQLAQLKMVQMEQKNDYDNFIRKIRAIEEATSILAANLPN
ncbi:unnamed protein product [Allacma fusca]|uniref:Uncharacterized protein n=1 Tax=Allacma fusca TaxID=39272 RepID=A0A8J2LUG2_9HEXA|nr:unnamed protein product [Allacma fusca]